MWQCSVWMIHSLKWHNYTHFIWFVGIAISFMPVSLCALSVGLSSSSSSSYFFLWWWAKQKHSIRCACFFRCVSLVKLYLPSDVSLDLSSDVCGRFSRTESIYLLCFCMWNLKERPFAQRRNVGFWKHIDARMRTKPFCLCITLCHSLCVSTKMTLRTKRQTQIYLFIISLQNSFWMNFFFSQWLLFAVLFSLCTHSDLMVSIVASWFFLLA